MGGTAALFIIVAALTRLTYSQIGHKKKLSTFDGRKYSITKEYRTNIVR